MLKTANECKLGQVLEIYTESCRDKHSVQRRSQIIEIFLTEQQWLMNWCLQQRQLMLTSLAIFATLPMDSFDVDLLLPVT